MQLAAWSREAAEDHLCDTGGGWQGVHDRSNGDCRRAIRGETVDPGGNRREGHRRKPVLVAELHRTPIARCKQSILVELPAIPHRANGMDHVPGGQPIALGDLCLAGRAAMKHTAFGDEIGSSGAMNRAVDTAATEQR